MRSFRARAIYIEPGLVRVTSHLNLGVSRYVPFSMGELAGIAETLGEAGLKYTTDRAPGISRRKVGDAFRYFGADGKQITDEASIDRIAALAIPPAYQDVWICADPNGHLQATGRDARGRKQYRYHSKFRELRDTGKFERMAEFGRALPTIHGRLDRDLALVGFPRSKVLATLVMLLERSLIRVGNEEYARENRSYGLTTLLNRHVTIEGSDIKFRFMGKSKVRHQITLHDRKLARVVRKLQELPGQELFQYSDSDGVCHSIHSHDVNAYLKEISGHDFTAKDFRTWAATVLAFAHLALAGSAANQKVASANVTSVIKIVARELGNTPAICRKCYVHPAVLKAYVRGELENRGEFESFLATGSNRRAVGDVAALAREAVVSLLEQHGTNKPARACAA